MTVAQRQNSNLVQINRLVQLSKGEYEAFMYLLDKTTGNVDVEKLDGASRDYARNLISVSTKFKLLAGSSAPFLRIYQERYHKKSKEEEAA